MAFMRSLERMWWERPQRRFPKTVSSSVAGREPHLRRISALLSRNPVGHDTRAPCFRPRFSLPTQPPSPTEPKSQAVVRAAGRLHGPRNPSFPSPKLKNCGVGWWVVTNHLPINHLRNKSVSLFSGVSGHGPLVFHPHCFTFSPVSRHFITGFNH
jgi:hypothetical protein